METSEGDEGGKNVFFSPQAGMLNLLLRFSCCVCRFSQPVFCVVIRDLKPLTMSDGVTSHTGTAGLSHLRAYPQPNGGYVIDCVLCGLILKPGWDSIQQHLLAHDDPPSQAEVKVGAESGAWPIILVAAPPTVSITPPMLTSDPSYEAHKLEIKETDFQCSHCLVTYLKRDGWKSHFRRAKGASHPGLPREGRFSVRAISLAGGVRYVDASLQLYTTAWELAAARNQRLNQVNPAADAKLAPAEPPRRPNLEARRIALPDHAVASPEDAKAGAKADVHVQRIGALDQSQDDGYGAIDPGDFVFASEAGNVAWSFQEADMKIKLPPHLFTDGKANYFINKYLKAEAFFSKVNICSDDSVRNTFRAVSLERTPSELQNRLFMRPEAARPFCRAADSNLMSMLPNDRAEARVISSNLRLQRNVVSYHHKLKRVAEKTLDAFSFTLVKFENLLLRKHNLAARLLATGLDVINVDYKDFITGSLVWVLKLPSVTATLVLKQFIAGCGINVVGSSDQANPAWFFNRPGSIAKRLSHLLRFAQYAIIANTRHNENRTALENENVARSLQHSPFLNGLREAITTLRQHEFQTQHQQNAALPEIDQHGNHSARMLDGSLITRGDMAAAADSLFGTAKGTVVNLATVQLNLCPELTDAVIEQCAIFYRQPFSAGLSRTEKIQIVVETMLEQKLNHSMRYDHCPRGNAEAERFVILNSWWKNPLLEAIRNRKGLVDDNLDGWGSLISLLHVTNGTPPRPSDYCLFDAPLLHLGANGKVVWKLDVTKSSAKIAAANFSMSDDCCPLVLLYLRLFQPPTSDEVLKNFSFKTCLNLRLSAAFGRQMLCEEEYRKVAAIFATFLAQDAMRDPSQAAGLTLLTNILQELMGHTSNTHLSASYVGSLISPITSEVWRRFVLLRPPENQAPPSISQFREDFSTTFASHIDRNITKLTATLTEEKKLEMISFLRGCADLRSQKVLATFPCGWGKKCGVDLMGSLARETGLKMKILHVLPNNFLAREQAQPGFGASCLDVKAIAWTDRLSMNDVGDDYDVVTVNFEQIMSYNFQTFYEQGKFFLCVMFDEAHEILEGWSWRPAVRRAARLLSAGGTVPMRYLSGSIPLAQREAFKTVLPHSTPILEFGESYGVIDEKKAVLVEKCSTEAEMLQRTINHTEQFLQLNPRSKVFVTCVDYHQVAKYSQTIASHFDQKTTVASLSKKSATRCDAWMDAENDACKILVATSLGNTGITCRKCDLVIGPGLRAIAQLLQAAGRTGRGVVEAERPTAQFMLYHCSEYVTRKFGVRGGSGWTQIQESALAGISNPNDWSSATDLYGPESIERLVATNQCFRVYLARTLDKRKIPPCKLCINCVNRDAHPPSAHLADYVLEPRVDESTWQAVRDGFIRLQERCAFCAQPQCRMTSCTQSQHAKKIPDLHRCCVCYLPPSAHRTIAFCPRPQASRNGIKSDICPKCLVPLEHLNKVYNPLRQYTSQDLFSTRLGDEKLRAVHESQCAGRNQLIRDRIRNAVSNLVAFGSEQVLSSLGLDSKLSATERVQNVWTKLQTGHTLHIIPLIAASMRFLPDYVQSGQSGQHGSRPAIKRTLSSALDIAPKKVKLATSPAEVVAAQFEGKSEPRSDKRPKPPERILTDKRLRSEPERNYSEMVECLKTVFKLDSFRQNQAEAISSIRAGQHVLLIKPTGGGKSVVYQLPAMLSGQGIGVIVCPLLSLLRNQIAQLQEEYDIPAVSLSSETKMSEVEIMFDKLKSGSVRLLYTTPEQLGKVVVQNRLSNLDVG